MSSEYLSQSPNEFFVFLFGKDMHIYAKLHRRLVKEELLRFCYYLDLTPKEVQKEGYEKVLARYFLEYKMKRLDSNWNLHLEFYNSVYNELKDYKRRQLRERRLQ